MVRRHEVTDQAWAAIEPLMPTPGRRNGRWRDHRQVLNAIVWKLTTGAPWRDIPERYGPWKTAQERLRLWEADGTWDKIFSHVQTHNDGEPVELVVHVDSTSVRAHQHSAGARKKGAAEVPYWRAGRRTCAVTPVEGEASAGPAAG